MTSEARSGAAAAAAPRSSVCGRKRYRSASADAATADPTRQQNAAEAKRGKRNVAEYASKTPRARTRKTAEKGPPAFSAMALAAKTTASVACATHAMAAISTASRVAPGAIFSRRRRRERGRRAFNAPARGGSGGGTTCASERKKRALAAKPRTAPRTRLRDHAEASSTPPDDDPSVAADAAPHAQCASRSASWRRASLAISRAVGRGICGGTHGVGAKFAGKRCGGAFAPAHLASLPGAAKTPHGSTPRSPATRGAPGEGRISAVVTATTGIWIAANASDRAQRDAHEAGERRRESVASGCATAQYACATAKATAKAQAHPPTRRHSCISATSRAYHAWSIAIEPGGDPRRAGAIAIARGDVRGRGAGGGGGETNDLKSRFKVRLGDDDGRRARDAARR